MFCTVVTNRSTEASLWLNDPLSRQAPRLTEQCPAVLLQVTQSALVTARRTGERSFPGVFILW